MKLNHKTHDINFVKGKEYIEFEGSFPKNMKRERCLYRKERQWKHELHNLSDHKQINTCESFDGANLC